MDKDDDVVELSSNALNALNEFYREQALAQQRQAYDDEDWELSQFWYDDETARRLASECLRFAPNGKIVCVSCPTAFKTLKDILSQESVDKFTAEVLLLEYDNRFARYGKEFLFYDYRNPLEIFDENRNLLHAFDVVIADPPFLAEECLLKTASTVKALAKEKTGKIILCTGAIMEDIVMKCFDGIKICDTFQPRHKSKLGNEFRCYVSYDNAFSVL